MISYNNIPITMTVASNIKYVILFETLVPLSSEIS